MMKKALVVATNHSNLENEKITPTGLWLSELTHFYDEFEQAGYHIDIVSPNGGNVPIDKRSLGFFVLDKATKARYQDPAFMSKLKQTKVLSDIDWQQYDIVYFAGGHGAMWDLVDNQELHSLTRNIYEAGKVVSAVCHGVAALLNVKLSNGDYLISAKKGTGFPYFDETIAGAKSFVPYNLEQVLKNRGMEYSKAFFPLGAHTVVDGRLITGQNPNSTIRTAKKALEVLTSLRDKQL
ncbi:type 1 glutamine amidotransferase domain-containing protein [Vibrio penaeicida]|uniref:type 1 glutamine amidotransferase domain-containing protein n=1 Tax=Vibrio penaeicida TaxID=104609 RepID=UPI000CE9FBF4|nr:type 1 glutamine amidotransferase domain-containing protein [Vibrio penaeicida]